MIEVAVVSGEQIKGEATTRLTKVSAYVQQADRCLPDEGSRP